jgi:hypothetical protein
LNNRFEVIENLSTIACAPYKVLFDESNYSVQRGGVVLESPESLRVTRRVEDWKLHLIDLTKRNKAIYFQPNKTSHLTIVSPDIEVVYSRLVERGRSWEIRQPPLAKPGEAPPKIRAPKSTEIIPGWSDPNQLDRTLRNMSRRSQSEYTERGIRILYVTFGQLKWNEKENGQEVISPLLLTPVELVRDSTREPYQIKVPPVEDIVLVNPALMLKLKYEHGLDLPILPEEEEQTPSSYLTKIQNSVDELGWTVEPTVYLGLFSFAKLAIYQDLTDNLSRIIEHPIVRSLAGVHVEGLIQKGLPSVGDLDAIVDPGKTYQILDADSSQQLCIQYALRGQSYVMHGPPGTGKSQTIANIISEYIAAGRSVLFVSEKMAALEVVYNRLKEKDLDEYCLELHSYKANKREVINELSRALTEHLKSSKGMSGEEIDRLKHRRTQLNTYVESLHKTRHPSNMSAYKLLNDIAMLESIPDIPSGYPSFKTLDQKTVFSLEELMRRLQNSWIVVEEGASFPWKGCNTTEYTMDVRSEWTNLLTTLIDSTKQLRSETHDYCEKLGLIVPKSLEDHYANQKLANMIEATPYPPMRWLQDADLTKIQSDAESHRQEWGEYWATRTELESKYDNRFRVLPRGTADRVEETWRSAAELLQPNPKGDGGLLRHFDDLRKFLGQTISDANGWGERSEKISEILGLPTDLQTVNTARRIHRITQLCESTNRPERSWLDKTNLELAEKYFEKARTEHRRRDEFKAKLAAYSEKITALDHPTLITYLEGPGSSPLRYLRPSYYRIRSEISRVTKNGEIPSTILQDLRLASELKELTKTITSEQEEARNKLGSYYKEGSPDFEAAEEAMKTARETLRLIGTSRAPKLLRDNLCIATKPREDLLVQGRSLGDSLQSWRAASRPLHIILPEKLPSSKTRITNIPLMELKEWAVELKRRLENLRGAIQPSLITSISDPPKTLTRLLSDIKKSEKLQGFEEEEAELAPQRRETYGGLYQGISTDWLKVIGAIDWTRGLLKALPPKPSAEVISFVTDSTLERPKLDSEKSLQELYRLIDELNSRFSSPLWGRRTQSLSVDEVLLVSERLAQRIDDLQAWVDYKKASSGLAEEGLGNFVKQLVEKRYNREQLIDVYRKSIYSGLFNRFAEEDPTLSSFRARDQDQAVDDFRSLDASLIEESSKKVIEAANAKKPQGVFVEASDSEITILLKEAAKKRRQMPLRHLFNRIPTLIRKLKPCLLMSPISVSQFILPDRLHFDLVVFDEASQILTEDAVGSIYRGDTLIVAGDNKQLPPTPFFQYIADSDAEWEEATDDVGAYDSVLDECMGMGLPVSMLRWHYRSKHDSLIVFSNKEFYDDKLVLFPSSIDKGGGLGIEFKYVHDGVYDRGGARNNPREAEVVADIVFSHFAEHPDKSLGVMTFSISQMNTVKDEIEARLAEHPEYDQLLQEDRLHGFFVKNLENVQGDERDVMVISVGYGYDKGRAMTMNFGPLNMEGGERRLNVAVTRAREKVIIVSSIKSSDIDLSSTKSVGVRCLHNYLAYAELTTKPEKPEKEITPQSEIEMEVAEEICKLGYVAFPQVGESSLRVDIGVKTPENPDRYILGIILDGEGYRSTATARDRDRLRAQVLEGMGWSLHRIWSPEWVQRRSTEVERLAQALKRAETYEKLPNKLQSQRTTQKKRTLEHQKVTERRSDELPGSESYRRASLEPSHTFNRILPTQKEIYLDLYRLEVRNLLPKLVRTEGPIHLEYAFKRLNKAVNLRPAPPSFHKIYWATVEELAKKGRFEKRGEFLWPNGTTVVKVRVPLNGPEAEVRPIEYIPPEEIETAMLHVLSYSMGLSRESLIQETANIFRAKQISKTNRILETELEKMLEGNKITRVGETLFTKVKLS